MKRGAFRLLSTALVVFCPALQAGILATGQLVAPLAPGQLSRVGLPVGAGLDPSLPVWVSYQLIALSEGPDPAGEVVIEGTFEGVATPISQMVVHFDAHRMTTSESAGTVATQLERIAGRRDPEEWRTLMGDALHATYEAVNAGRGRILNGQLVRHLPAPAGAEGLLLVSVERASGVQPLGLRVVAGQGEMPPELAEQGAASGSFAYTAGRLAGGLLFLGLLYWLLVARRRS